MLNDYDPDAAYEAWMLSRETETEREVDAAAIAAMDAQPAAKAIQFTYEGERCWAIRTGDDEFVIRHETEYETRPSSGPDPALITERGRPHDDLSTRADDH